MRRLGPLLLLLATALPTLGHAQASQFGIRGLGLPGRASSARALALGGSFSPFDGESSVNPATLGTLNVVTTVFTSGAAWRNTTNPAGEASLSDTRFPQIMVGGPVPGSRLGVGISYSTFTDRDFFTVSRGTASPRGEPVNYIDSLVSLGGVNDMRLAVSYRRTSRLLFGGGLHFLTGSNRLMGAREWEDPSYLAVSERAELAYFGLGFSAGFLMQPMSGLAIAGSIRKDGPLEVRLDSTEAISTTIDMPLTLSGGLRGRIKGGVELSGAVMYRSWSKADAGLKHLGGIGAANTLEFSGGVEVTRNSKRPTQFPVRLGARYTDLPFLISAGIQPKEWNLSIGSGFRFSGDHGGIDFSLQRFNRSQGDGYHENGWILNIGASVRAAGVRP